METDGMHVGPDLRGILLHGLHAAISIPKYCAPQSYTVPSSTKLLLVLLSISITSHISSRRQSTRTSTSAISTHGLRMMEVKPITLPSRLARAARQDRPARDLHALRLVNVVERIRAM